MPPHSPDHKSSADGAPASAAMRLQRYLAATGLGSRRKCEEYIVAGRVSVDGQVIRDLGTRVDPHQEVRVDTEVVRRDPPRYFLLNKPRGYLCTSSDPAGRPRAIDLVPQGKLRLFTVGRLDEGSEGLILLTNDGELAHRLAHPRFQVRRTYGVQVAGRPTPETYSVLKEGLYFQEGRFRVHWVKRVGTKGNSTLLEVGLSHGQNREIRRLFARVGHKVMRLRRVAFGPLSLGRLAEGRCRTLTGPELTALKQLASAPRRHPREKSGELAQARRGRRSERPDRRDDAATHERPRVPGERGSRHTEGAPTGEQSGGRRRHAIQEGTRRGRHGSGSSQHAGSQHSASQHSAGGSARSGGSRSGANRSGGSRSASQRTRGNRKLRHKHA
jgi:23S rRNA pseudouridine2605 synthase